jgi:TPR repeat protein
MGDKSETGLQHVPRGGALSLGSARSGILARGRRDAANSTYNPHYRQAIADYTEGRFAEAAEGFRRAAEPEPGKLGHAESQYVLSTMYDAGEGVPQDEGQAAYWERKAAEQGHAYAQANLSFRYYADGDYAQAFAWCQRAAQVNLAWAQYNLGLMYRKGEGVAQSNVEAAHWYRLAAMQDFAEAQQRLGDLYFLGQGVPRNYAQAAEWYGRAANQGNAEAQFQLGYLYALGQGVEHDYTQSRYWTRQAAMQGHGQAILELKRREYRDP